MLFRTQAFISRPFQESMRNLGGNEQIKNPVLFREQDFSKNQIKK
jgi:hypothetical protein